MPANANAAGSSAATNPESSAVNSPAANSSSATEPARPTIVLTRIFDAPRELVFSAWTDPKHFAKWWGPKGFTNPTCELDARPGGAIRVFMQAPNGTSHAMGGRFIEIVPPERLVFLTNAFEDAQGAPQLEVHNTVTFAVHEGKTKVTLRAVVTKASAAVAGPLSGMEAGWSQSLDKLGDLISGL